MRIGAGTAGAWAFIAEQTAAGARIIAVDTLNDADLMTPGAAFADMVLVTGGSGTLSPRPAATPVALVHHALADFAASLQATGFTRFINAGGETSAAVVAAPGAGLQQIGPEIDPGVAWTRHIQAPDLVLSLKSGSFGTPDFLH